MYVSYIQKLIFLLQHNLSFRVPVNSWFDHQEIPQHKRLDVDSLLASLEEAG